MKNLLKGAAVMAAVMIANLIISIVCMMNNIVPMPDNTGGNFIYIYRNLSSTYIYSNPCKYWIFQDF